MSNPPRNPQVKHTFHTQGDQNMKVLSLHQPYASLIAIRAKTIETRSWAAPASLIGQRIAIHAAARVTGRWGTRTEIGPYEVERDMSGLLLRGPLKWPYRLPLGEIVATARLVECVRMVHIMYVIAEHPDVPWPNIQLNGTDSACVAYSDGKGYPVNDQIPFGDFKHGRWAWMLDEIEPLSKPIPFKGGQGLSRSWTPSEVAA